MQAMVMRSVTAAVIALMVAGVPGEAQKRRQGVDGGIPVGPPGILGDRNRQ